MNVNTREAFSNNVGPYSPVRTRAICLKSRLSCFILLLNTVAAGGSSQPNAIKSSFVRLVKSTILSNIYKSYPELK